MLEVNILLKVENSDELQDFIDEIHFSNVFLTVKMTRNDLSPTIYNKNE